MHNFQIENCNIDFNLLTKNHKLSELNLLTIVNYAFSLNKYCLLELHKKSNCFSMGLVTSQLCYHNVPHLNDYCVNLKSLLLKEKVECLHSYN